MKRLFKTMKVGRIADDIDRILFYPVTNSDDTRLAQYHVIAGMDAVVELGDTIEYEPVGVNFGFFEKVIK